MKRYIVINSSRTALIITDHLHSGVELVASDSAINDEIFAFDTSLNVCYSYKKTIIRCKQMETLMQFENFITPEEIYKSIIASFIK